MAAFWFRPASNANHTRFGSQKKRPNNENWVIFRKYFRAHLNYLKCPLIFPTKLPGTLTLEILRFSTENFRKREKFACALPFRPTSNFVPTSSNLPLMFIPARRHLVRKKTSFDFLLPGATEDVQLPPKTGSYVRCTFPISMRILGLNMPFFVSKAISNFHMFARHRCIRTTPPLKTLPTEQIIPPKTWKPPGTELSMYNS